MTCNMRTLLMLAAVIASVMSAAVLYKEVEVHPDGISHQVLGYELAKQHVGPIQYTSSEFPIYGQQHKDHLPGAINYHPEVDSIVGLQSGYLDSDDLLHHGSIFPTLSHQTGHIGVIDDVDSTPIIYASQQPLLGHNIGKYDTVLNHLIGRQTGYHGIGQEDVLHGSEIQRLLQGTDDQIGSLYVDDIGNVHAVNVHPKLAHTLLNHQLDQLAQQAVDQEELIHGDHVQGLGYVPTQQTGHYYVDGNGILWSTLQNQEGLIRDIDIQGKLHGIGEDIKLITNEKGYPTIHVIDPSLSQHGVLNHQTRSQLSHLFGVGGGVPKSFTQGKYYPSQLVYPSYHHQMGSDLGLEEVQEELHPTIRVIRGGSGHVGYDVGKGHMFNEATHAVHPMTHQIIDDWNTMELQGQVYPTKQFTGNMFGHQMNQHDINDDDMQGSLLKQSHGHGVSGGEMMHQTKMYPSQVPQGVKWNTDLIHYHY